MSDKWHKKYEEWQKQQTGQTTAKEKKDLVIHAKDVGNEEAARLAAKLSTQEIKPWLKVLVVGALSGDGTVVLTREKGPNSHIINET